MGLPGGGQFWQNGQELHVNYKSAFLDQNNGAGGQSIFLGSWGDIVFIRVSTSSQKYHPDPPLSCQAPP